MKPVFILFCAFVLSYHLHAQQRSHPVTASRDDLFSSMAQPRAFPDTVRLLAVMVQFQADTDPLTSGNGQFDLSTPALPDVDAPPHDAPYFADHLTFLVNYYNKASHGKVFLQPTLVPQPFTLPSPMSNYSPPKNGSNEAVARLARDTWRMVDSAGTVPDIASYDCFVVFHAGVGRDIDLVGTLGYDPTPRDIPSLYLGLAAFADFFGPGYPGIPVRNGFVTNSIVIPETEFRMLPGVGGDVPLRLGINGMLCASVGNFLSLPDLFDTKTGRSVLGRFGLMDGQSIFSFGGTFPPMPSAWERYWMGWVTPIDVPPGTSTIQLPAVTTADTVYRVSVSPHEYFLIENRNRDPRGDGQRVTLRYRGMQQTVAVRYDTAGFNADDITLLKGVVTDVEDLDWSLPGVRDPDGTFYDGGVLIWHVDESVISAAIGQNAVNANPARRGVDLEEADGSQDIGQEYGLLSPGAGSEAGTPLDFWFLGNGSPIYKNAFSGASLPNSNAYGEVESHITVRNFSARGARMQAEVVRGDAQVMPLVGFPRTLEEGSVNRWSPVTVVDSGAANGAAFFVTNTSLAGVLYGWGVDGGTVPFPHKASGEIARQPAPFVSAPTPVWLGPGAPGSSYNGLAVIREGGFLDAFRFTDGDNDSLADLAFTVPVNTIRTSTQPPVVTQDGLSILVLTVRGRITAVGMDGTIVRTLDVTQDTTEELSGFALTASEDIVATTVRGRVIRLDLTTALPVRSVKLMGTISAPPAVARTADGYLTAATTDQGLLYLLDPTLTPLPGYPVSLGNIAAAVPPVLADIDGDKRKDVIVVGVRELRVYSAAGVLLDNFPVQVSTDVGALACNPVVADVNGDGTAEIVVATVGGTVTAIDRTGRAINGFPLTAGHGIQRLAVARKSGAASALIVNSEVGSTVSAWTINAGANVSAPFFPWPQYQHDAWHRGYDDTILGPPVPFAGGFFPGQRAYNWPNPVYGNTTYLRYYVGQDAAVRIKIYDLAGGLVKELSGPGVGGVDNEVVWDVSGVQSGVYFAHIEARGAAGGTGEAVVKVAVVK